MSIKRFLFLFLGLTIASGCLDELDLDPPRNVQDGIVITAKLIHGNPSVIEVDLNRVFDFTGQSLQRVGVRNVTLHNDLGESVLVTELQAGEHYQELDASFTVEAGVSYYLTIGTFDGRELQSAPDRLEAVPEAVSIDVRPIQKDGVNTLGENIKVPFLEFLVETPIRSSESSDVRSRLKWDFQRTYQVTDEPTFPATEGNTCFVTGTANPTRVAVRDGNAFNSDQINVSIYDEQVTSLFAEGYYLTVFQQSLSAQAFEYWDAIAQSIERTGGLFEAPAGRIRTNFDVVSGEQESDIFGFFYATQQDTLRFFVSPEMAGNPTPSCPPPPVPPPPGGGCPVPVCCDCLSVPGSSFRRPDFWTN